jgi:hypothetical protein
VTFRFEGAGRCLQALEQCFRDHLEHAPGGPWRVSILPMLRWPGDEDIATWAVSVSGRSREIVGCFHEEDLDQERREAAVRRLMGAGHPARRSGRGPGRAFPPPPPIPLAEVMSHSAWLVDRSVELRGRAAQLVARAVSLAG